LDDIKEYKIYIFVMGDDWEGKFDFLKEYCEVVYLKRTPEVSTTKIKNELRLNDKFKWHYKIIVYSSFKYIY